MTAVGSGVFWDLLSIPAKRRKKATRAALTVGPVKRRRVPRVGPCFWRASILARAQMPSAVRHPPRKMVRARKMQQIPVSVFKGGRKCLRGILVSGAEPLEFDFGGGGVFELDDGVVTGPLEEFAEATFLRAEDENALVGFGGFDVGVRLTAWVNHGGKMFIFRVRAKGRFRLG